MRSKIFLITLVAALLLPATKSAAPTKSGRPRQTPRFVTFNASLERNTERPLRLGRPFRSLMHAIRLARACWPASR
jgi:hypothetical protein